MASQIVVIPAFAGITNIGVIMTFYGIIIISIFAQFILANY